MILAINCSSRKGDFALSTGEFFQIEDAAKLPLKLNEAGVKVDSIEKILLTIGPGSFTSLRVGLSMAQGIALKNEIDILGYSTFRVMVEGRKGKDLIPILPARRRVVYAAHFRRDGEILEEIFTDRIFKIDELIDYVERKDIQPSFFGEGAEKNREFLENRGYSVTRSEPLSPGLLKLYKKDVPFIQDPEKPLYISPSAPVRKMSEKRGLNIRKMEVRDIKSVLRIERDVFNEPWDRDAFYYLSARKDCLKNVIEKEGEVIGYILGCPEGDSYHLMNVAVKRDSWRKGVASFLINQFLKEIKEEGDFKSCYLEHRISNNAAFELYKSLGFRVINIKKQYYKNGEDAVIMETGL